ncbi:sugar porter family MFS transporter [Aestuariibacter sp. A3R04]|uniref:sugar porter family MFS transporter n=1 Tax=Aestuariibacter sp. A3R04 TaxID=2841571 RepID=UPI001C0889C0|nr:sugar porter family MFS transporter [Aestuariibacter sp. A3R04]MBU3021486.1 sugar porter family MFS transporter [Aestuariibacter sp. A3R04]
MQNKILKLALIASLGGFLFGFDTAVISGTTDMVKQQYQLDDFQEGWFVSSGLVGCVLGVLMAGIVGDLYGRKPSLLFSAVLFTVSALGCAMAATFSWLVIFRIVGGVGVGVASMLSPIYISEIAPQKIRGRLTSLYQLAITVGILSAFLSNAFVGAELQAFSESALTPFVDDKADEAWRLMFAVEVIPALAFIVLLLFIPRSPRWLWTKGRTKQAAEIVERFGISDFDAVVNGPEHTKTSRPVSGKIKLAILAGALLAISTQTSGINAIMYYGNSILSKGGMDTQSAFIGQVFVGSINVLFTFIAIFTIDIIGRKRLLYIGVTGIILSLTLTGIMFYTNAHSSLKLTFILTFVACYAFSYGPVIWVLLSELFPTNIRSRAMSVAVLALWIANTLVGQLIPFMRSHLGEAGIFWIFALCCVPTYFIANRFLPETKGMSLEEIEEYWLRK